MLQVTWKSRRSARRTRDVTEQTMAALEDREKEIGPVREDSRGLLSLWAIYADEEMRIWIMMMLGRSRRMRKKITHIY